MSAHPLKCPYEIHLTVNDVGRDEFVEACAAAKVKPVLLELHSRSNGIIADAMTSSTIMGTYQDALKEMARVSVELRLNYGMAVTRYKLETAPWNPLIPPVADRNAAQYFECHMALFLPPQMSTMQIRGLSNLCAGNNLHLSRNVFKDAGDYVVHMATLRDYKATRDQFESNVASCLSVFDQAGVTVGKHDIEFALLDTNPKHDNMWMDK